MNEERATKPANAPAKGRLVPPVWFLLSLLAMTGLHFGWPGARWIEAPWNALGALPFVAGVALIASASRAFVRHQTTIKPFEPSSALVCKGVFARTRNPMYLGLVLMLASTAAGFGTATPWAVPPLFAIWIEFAFIRREEARLLAQFGDEYAAYLKKVRRWI